MNKNKYKKIVKFLTKSEYSFSKEKIEKHCIDWREDYKGTSELILFPKTVKKISDIVKVCNKEKIAIVPQGGNTGLVGGSVPRKNRNEIILNLRNLNHIREVDSIGHTVTVESGCILEDIKNKLYEKKLEFPLSMGSKGNCQIGGNISTNAGGVNVIKYGTFRQNILGLEAVLPDGSIFNSLKKVKKNNTGIDIKQLLIGTEGILGIVTAATIKIYPLPKEKVVLWGSFSNFRDVIDFYKQIIIKFYGLITSFEFMNKESIEILEKNEMKLEKLKKGECYCLIEISNFNNLEKFSNFIISNIPLEDINSDDLIISKSDSENKKLWKYRESIPLAEKKEGFIIPHDISIPLVSIDSFVKQTSKNLKKILNGIKIINFGHLGDNNLHFNVLISQKQKYNKRQIIKMVNTIVYDGVNFFGGSISAEHGIGQLRRKELKNHKKQDEIRKMKDIKNIFDPNNILNPGKVI